jgi:hypothetical protein
MNQTTQVPCPSCHKPTWVYPGTSIPCQSCGTPVAGPASSPVQIPQQFAPPPAPAAPAEKSSIKIGGFSVPIGAATARSPKKMIGLGILVAILAMGGWFLKDKFLPKKGVVSYSSLGVDRSKPLADDLYKALAKDAKKWKSDSMFWSLNFHAVRMDGTVDISKPAIVDYVSPSNSASSHKKTRSNSLREYNATGSGMKAKARGWLQPVKDLEPHPTPACTIKQLLAKLQAEGIVKTPTVRVSFDPKFADFYAWTLFIEGAPKPLSFSWENCEPIK